MNIIDNPLYKEDIKNVLNRKLPWQKLKNSSVLITGATGFMGSFLVDVLMMLNKEYNVNCKVYALGRNVQKAEKRFDYCYGMKEFQFIQYDINKPFVRHDIEEVDFVLHLASNTHPISYATDPIGTITTNIIGAQNIFEFAYSHRAKRCVYASSNEVYGENRGDVELFKETYCGYIDCNSMRAGYPESKRCGEALCQAYIKQRGMDIVIPRFTRSYGPTLQDDDSKAISQFFHKALNDEDIVLKSKGTQFYSYTYVADAICGLLYVLLLGEKGEAYNISDLSSDIMMIDLANLIAKQANKKVVFQVPDEIESSGYSKATKARLDSTKIKELGWSAMYSITEGVQRTYNILKQK